MSTADGAASGRPARAFRHGQTILHSLLHPAHRRLLRQTIALSARLPALFDLPLPEMMARLTPTQTDLHLPPDDIRGLADAVAAWHFWSPLGICLRRSLLRYVFLRRAGLPVQIVFGARLKTPTEGGGLGGHAWLVLQGQPYHEDPANYTAFVEMYRYPPDPKCAA